MARGSKGNVVQLYGDGSNQVIEREPDENHYLLAEKLCPKHRLSAKELEFYEDIAPYLVMLGRLKKLYVNAFVDYCRILAKIEDIRDRLLDEGDVYIVQSRNGEQRKAHPLVAQSNELFRQARTYIGEFGLAPASARALLNGMQLDVFEDHFDNERAWERK